MLRKLPDDFKSDAWTHRYIHIRLIISNKQGTSEQIKTTHFFCCSCFRCRQQWDDFFPQIFGQEKKKTSQRPLLPPVTTATRLAMVEVMSEAWKMTKRRRVSDRMQYAYIWRNPTRTQTTGRNHLILSVKIKHIDLISAVLYIGFRSKSAGTNFDSMESDPASGLFA